MPNKPIPIKCRMVLSKDVNDKDFGKVCEHTIAETDGKGRIRIYCNKCGKPTVLTLREILPENAASGIKKGTVQEQQIKDSVLEPWPGD